MWLIRLLVIIAVVVAVWYVVRAVRAGGLPGSRTPVSFTPVEELPASTREHLDTLLATGRTIEAIKEYREATGAGLQQSKTAVETYRWKQGGQAS